jgi:hypothetical protein
MLLTLVTIISCNKNPTKSDNDKITDINGNWEGTTSQNELVSFKIDSSTVTFFTIKIKTSSEDCKISLEPLPGHYITKVIQNSFSFNYSGLYISATFKTNTKCDGSFSYNGTSGNWSASKKN